MSRKSVQRPMPLYPSLAYRSFCRNQKQWLPRRYWKDLPAMWEEEKRFRASFELALFLGAQRCK